MQFTHKIVQSGKYLHSYIYDIPIKYGFKRKPKIKQYDPAGIVDELFSTPDPIPEKQNQSLRNVNSNAWRTKRTIKQLLECNIKDEEFRREINQTTFFITYTFGDNVQDFETANYEFTKYIQRLNYELTGDKKATLKYLTVPERQQRGAIHFHTVHFGLPYIEKIYDTIAATWGRGFVWVEKINDLHHLINYVSKYITKKPIEERGQKAFFCSKGLQRPTVHRIENANSPDSDLLLGDSQPGFSKVFETLYNIVDYTCYENVL